jgi:hypothetical protein
MKKLIPLTAVALLTATPALADVPASDTFFGGLIFLWLTIIGICLYGLPAIIGFGRQHQHRVPILLTNLFLGWTLIGWVAALVWSAMPVSNPKLPPPLPFQS